MSFHLDIFDKADSCRRIREGGLGGNGVGLGSEVDGRVWREKGMWTLIFGIHCVIFLSSEEDWITGRM
jgi:hypothetical protein